MKSSKFKGRLFYIKNSGQIYECFNSKSMEEVEPQVLKELYMFSRRDGVKFTQIGESQVNGFKKMLNNKTANRLITDPIITLKQYFNYGILSREEYKELKVKIQD